MKRSPFSRLLAVAGLSAGAALPLAANPAAAATCSGSSGVSVVVDFGDTIRTGCAAGDPTNAWAAIQAAGFTLQGTQRFPASFICRVDGYPGSDREACIQTPPATAYWAVWTATAGGAWSYSTTGAATLDPVPGTALGLAFGAGRAPAQAPPTTPAPPATSTHPATPSSTRLAPTSTSPTAPGTPAERPGSTTAGTHTPSPATTRTGTHAGTTGPTSTSSPPTASSSSAPAAALSTTSPGATTAVAAPGPHDRSPMSTVLGGGAIGLLLVLGALVVRRQRDRATQA